MSTLTKLALTLAVATSGVALLDATLGGLTGEPTVLAAESGMSLPLLFGSLLHAAAYVALALLLHVHGDRIDAGSRTRRVSRIGLQVSYLLMALFFGPAVTGAWMTGADPSDLPHLLTLPAALGFAGLFLCTITLGIALLKVPGMRLPALVLTGVTAGIGLTSLLGALDSDFAHPAYPEALAYVGTALIGVGSVPRPVDRRLSSDRGAVRPST
jgi:hypothetical protein